MRATMAFLLLTAAATTACADRSTLVDITVDESPAIALVAASGDGGYPWRDHAPPFPFVFGNHIDTHQQLKVAGSGKLVGFFYIRFDGTMTDGYPNATHGDCPVIQEECVAGWKLAGVPAVATLIEKLPGQHPTWCVDSADRAAAKGYTHFHWLGEPEHAHSLVPGSMYDGYLLRLTAIQPFFFQHHGGFTVDPGLDVATHSNVVTDC